ncbi:uracil phosphoribosyltransferase-domain-containing protein, partial [Diaporthe sp. PMI_573]
MGQDGSNRLKQYFGHLVWGYSYRAFRQATWLYEEIPEPEFERLCQVIASEVTLHPELADLLASVGKLRHVRAVVVTCGIKRIWEVVLQSVQSSAHVDIIGGGRISDCFVVTPGVKAAIVERLRKHYGVQVYAFGDSEVDIPMLMAADHPFVVTGDVETRSKSMDQALMNAISGGLRPRQILLPTGSRPRLAEGLVPVVEMDAAFASNTLARRSNTSRLGRIHATDSAAAKLLMTPMRDAGVAGPGLREAHRRAGWWIATQHVSEMIGCEETAIVHVQKHRTEGYRLLDEEKTVIVAMMRGGEPMALGVSEAFPAALFVHANTPEDLKEQQIKDQSTILLVDSVVNSGKTIVGFIEHIRSVEKKVQVVVIAGVIQAKFFKKPPTHVEVDWNVGFVAMRLSENEFKGKGQTDTGNRLFNTTRF